jgi:hypothetical protein
MRGLFHWRMDETPNEKRWPKLLSERDAAERLSCSPNRVKQLRLKRKLAYYPGRPIRIMEDDLAIYVASAKVRRIKPHRKSKIFKYISADALPKPFALLTVAEAAIKFSRTPRQIRYLCLRGRIPYILGRPPWVDELDLAEYYESKRLAALAKIPPSPGTPEFSALQARKAKEKMLHKLRVQAVRRQVARTMAERKT